MGQAATGTPPVSSFRAGCLDVAAHYVFVALVCAFFAGLVAALAGWGLWRWAGLTALLSCLDLISEWRGPFWSVRIEDQGLVLRAVAWRRQVRFEDIEFVQAGTFLERFTAAASSQTFRIETRQGTLKARLPPRAAGECLRLLGDRAHHAELVDLTGMDLRNVTGLSGSLAHRARDLPNRSTGSHARAAHVYQSAGAWTLGIGVVLMALAVVGAPAAVLRERTWTAVLGIGSRALYLGAAAAGLISLGRGLWRRGLRERRGDRRDTRRSHG